MSDDTIARETPHPFVAGRADTVICALTGMHESRMTWCGRDVGVGREWVFTDASHALLSTGSRLALCPECGAAVAKRARERVDGVME